MEIAGIYEMESLGRECRQSSMQFLPCLFIAVAVYAVDVAAVYMRDVAA
jgi:hypothetical protein